jgi:hypothetical protein
MAPGTSAQVNTTAILAHVVFALCMMVVAVVLIVVGQLRGDQLMVVLVAYVAANSAHGMTLAANSAGLTVSTTAIGKPPTPPG